jgi:hypothetical protein
MEALKESVRSHSGIFYMADVTARNARISHGSFSFHAGSCQAAVHRSLFAQVIDAVATRP